MLDSVFPCLCIKLGRCACAVGVASPRKQLIAASADNASKGFALLRGGTPCLLLTFFSQPAVHPASVSAGLQKSQESLASRRGSVPPEQPAPPSLNRSRILCSVSMLLFTVMSQTLRCCFAGASNFLHTAPSCFSQVSTPVPCT